MIPPKPSLYGFLDFLGVANLDRDCEIAKFKNTNYTYDPSRLQELNDIASTPPRGFSAM
jgi:hypothetical protein